MAAYDSAPTFIEQGLDTEFVNWRGFFGPPGLSEEKRERYIDTFESDVRHRCLGDGPLAQRLV